MCLHKIRFLEIKKMSNMATLLAGRDRFRYSIKQADMCLVCIAFASWVLKSTNPQSTDMWKAGKTQ